MVTKNRPKVSKKRGLFKVHELPGGKYGSVGPLYRANLNSKASLCVNQGGTSSGKTYAILQVLFTILVQEKATATVVGQDIPNLKAGALRDALNIFEGSKSLKSLIESYNKSDRVFTFNNGSILEFKSYEDSQDAKSGKRDYLFINEANGISYDIYEQLSLRTSKREFLDYNPNAEFWAHDLKGKDSVEFFYSDHRHNPFVPQRIRDKIEVLKEKDYELWKVYARGKTGKIEGLIFRNWEIITEVPAHANLIGSGMDFGFTNDPTTVIDVYEADGELIVDELVYETGLTNKDIESRIKGKRNRIIADSADPKSIEELTRMGFRIEGAKKGPDSVINGIDILKRYHIKITQRSVNTRKEFSNYKWKVDKATGKAINEPVDFMNHAIDAVRYLALNLLGLPLRKIKHIL